jgi:hypothetical protein
MFSNNGTVNRPAELQPLIKLLIIYLDMYVIVGELGRNTIQVRISEWVANGWKRH